MNEILKTFFIPLLSILLLTSNISCSFKNEDEYTKASKIITNTYKTLLKRDPDKEGLDTYTKLLMEGTSIESIEDTIKNSEEYKSLQR